MQLALPVLVACAPLVVLAAVNLVAVSELHPMGGDFALLELGARRALEGEALLGPYSRFGWHHLGPAMFYWLAPFYALSGSRPGGMALAAVVLNLLWVATIVGVLGGLRGRAAAWVTAAVVVVLIGGLGLLPVHSPWNPHLVILPVLALGVLGAVLASGHRWALPLVVVTASFVAQTHVAAVPVALALLVTSLVIGVARHRRPAKAWSAPLMAATLVAAVLWTPVLYQEVTASEGNISDVTSYFLDGGNGDTEPAGWSGVRDPLAVSLTPLAYGDPLSGGPHPAQPVLAALLVPALVAALVIGLRRRYQIETALAALALAGVGASVLASLAVQEVPYLYLFTSVVGVGALAWLALGLMVVRLVRERGGAFRYERSSDGVRITHAAVPLALAVLSVMIATDATYVGPWNRGGSRDATIADEDVRALGAAVAADPTLFAGRSVLFEYQSDFTTATGLVNELDKQGLHVTVLGPSQFVFGDATLPTGDEQISLVLFPGDLATPPQRPMQLVGRGPDTALYRAEVPRRVIPEPGSRAPGGGQR
ncbi:hypothetical protein BH20ACT2_BH20ACT2_08760 [soil metagenome]